MNISLLKKIRLVDKIKNLHPAYGADLKWSEYVGGMRDTGQWFDRVLYEQDYDVLEAQYEEWITPTPRRELTVEEKELSNKTLIIEVAGAKYVTTALQQKWREDFQKDMERKMLNL